MSVQTDFALPARYEENPLASADGASSTYWGAASLKVQERFQVPVYRLALQRARERRTGLVVDIGCGSGKKLTRFFESFPGRVIGVDQESGIAIARHRSSTLEWICGDLEDDQLWRDLRNVRPDLVICSDVIEHLRDPITLLNRLSSLVGSGLLILSTPDRSHMENAAPLGPPMNPLHVREWTTAELCRLVTDCGFDVERVHHLLPRGYSVSLHDLRLLAIRALRGLTLPEPRSCQVLELRTT